MATWFDGCDGCPNNPECVPVQWDAGKHMTSTCRTCGDQLDDNYDEMEEFYA